MIWADEGKRENKNKQIYCCCSQWFKDPSCNYRSPRYVAQKKRVSHKNWKWIVKSQYAKYHWELESAQHRLQRKIMQLFDESGSRSHRIFSSSLFHWNINLKTVEGFTDHVTNVETNFEAFAVLCNFQILWSPFEITCVNLQSRQRWLIDPRV